MSSSVDVTELELTKGFTQLSDRMLREIEPLTAPVERLSAVGAFIGHGGRDGVLPITWKGEADAWLTRLGISHETNLFEMAHEVSEAKLQDISTWLQKMLQYSA